VLLACPSTSSGRTAAWYFFFIVYLFRPVGEKDIQGIENHRQAQADYDKQTKRAILCVLAINW
jgi:hypothetical protein